jgi:Leucine-rich repeat (LRR) protein
MTTFNKYIERIEKNDTTLDLIKLNTGINNDDAVRLIQALNDATTEVVNRIKVLDISYSKLTTINVLTKFTALTRMSLCFNQLTSIEIPTTLTALESLDLSFNRLTSIEIPTTLTALSRLDLENNRLTSIKIPKELTALGWLYLNNNQLTSIKIPEELTALRKLELGNNQLISINIPATLTALKQLWLYNNRLTNIDISATLTALRELELSNNQLTNINIPAELTALKELFLNSNQLTSIDIPETLIALKELSLGNNRLTEVTKLALTTFAITVPNLNITCMNNNIAPQLTSEILQEHFEVIKPTLLSNLVSVEFKQMVLAMLIQKMLPELISLIAANYENNHKPLLNKNIQMLRRCFNNNKPNKEILNSWLRSTQMNNIRASLENEQIIKINEIDTIYSDTNSRKMLRYEKNA